MILREFPDLQWLKKQAEQSFSNRKAWGGGVLPTEGWPSVILNTKTKETFRDNIRGPLSIFTNITGESLVKTGSRNVKVANDFFFVTNHDQHYTLEVNQPKETETFNIHFGEHFADKVLSTLINKTDTLLENHFVGPDERLEFQNKLYHRDETFNSLILQIRSQKENNSLYLDEKLYELLSHLLQQESQVRKIKNQIPVLKSSTREEIVRRLFISTDYIYTFYNRNLSLDELASVACLSKFHFLRLFKIAFRKTPYQFINEVRVKNAKTLLKNSTFEVNEIAKILGFDDSSSFSRMFHHQVGVYPTQYR